MSWDEDVDENEDFRSKLNEELFEISPFIGDEDYNKAPYESLWETIDRALNDFYHERVVPLEKQIEKLGGVAPDKSYINYKIYTYNPADPFKEVQEYKRYFEDPESEYYNFFVALFDNCMESALLTLQLTFDYDDAKKYWLWIFGCVDEADIAYKIDGTFIHPFKWSAQKNLCVYLLHLLVSKGYVTQRFTDKALQQHFLPESSTTSIANMRTPFAQKVNGIELRMPRGHDKIELMVSDILNSLD